MATVALFDSVRMSHEYWSEGKNFDYTLRCDFAFVARGTGGAISWTGGKREWFAMVDGQPMQVDTLSAAQAAEFWGKGSIASGDSARSGWRFSAPEAFRLVHTFAFAAAGESAPTGTVRHEITCPAARPPFGWYVLRGIGPKPLPAPIPGRIDSIFADTLVFRLNVTVYPRVRMGRGPLSFTTGYAPIPYLVRPSGEAEILSGSGGLFVGGRLRIVGDTVFALSENSGPNDWWRFVRIPDYGPLLRLDADPGAGHGARPRVLSKCCRRTKL